MTPNEAASVEANKINSRSFLKFFSSSTTRMDKFLEIKKINKKIYKKLTEHPLIVVGKL